MWLVYSPNSDVAQMISAQPSVREWPEFYMVLLIIHNLIPVRLEFCVRFSVKFMDEMNCGCLIADK